MSEPLPEWVLVWRWARESRRPLELRAFPQQDGREHGGASMTWADYEALVVEWRTSLAPREASFEDFLREIDAKPP